jgi:hypothetical protein
MDWRDSMLIAAEQRLITNSYYGARISGEHLSRHCGEMLETTLEGRLEPHAAYVLSPGSYVRMVVNAGPPPTHFCELADGFILCEAGSPGADHQEALAEIIPSAPENGVIGFGAPPDVMFLDGWTQPGTDGTLTSGDARFAFRLTQAQQRRTRFLEFDLFGFVPREAQGYEISLDGKVVVAGRITRSAPSTKVTIPLPETQGGLYIFHVVSSDPASPASVGASEDSRVFGIGIRTIRLLGETVGDRPVSPDGRSS